MTGNVITKYMQDNHKKKVKTQKLRDKIASLSPERQAKINEMTQATIAAMNDDCCGCAKKGV